MLRSLLGLAGAGGCVPRTIPPGLMFLLKLAWQSQVRLPLLIALGFMLSDYTLQLDINFEMHTGEETMASENNNRHHEQSERSLHGPAGLDLHMENIVTIDCDDDDEEEEEENDSEDSSSDSDWERSPSVDTVIPKLDDPTDMLSATAVINEDR